MPSYHDMAVPIYQRQLGVFFFDQQNVEQGQSFEIYSRQCHVGSFKKMLVEPIYPSAMEVPSMMELLDPQHTELDDDRFNLLKFIINEKILKDADLQAVPQCFFLDVLTLTAMKAVGAVSADEADVFLFTVMKVKQNEVPEDIEYPPTVDGRAFILAFAFGKFREVVSNILETLGLFKLQASWILFEVLLELVETFLCRRFHNSTEFCSTNLTCSSRRREKCLKRKLKISLSSVTTSRRMDEMELRILAIFYHVERKLF